MSAEVNENPQSTKNTKQDLWLEIIQQMEQRRQLGLQQYGVPVTATPDVDWRKHLEEELLDGIVYNRAAAELEKKYRKLLKYIAVSWATTEEEVERIIVGK